MSYKKTLDTRAAAQVLEDRNRLCAQRANLQTAGALTEELRRMSLEHKERTVDAIEGIYEVLSPEDGHKLRAYADKSKEGTSLVGSDDELSTDRNPDSFFAALCAGSQR